MRRTIAFLVVFLLLAGLAGGLGYFQFFVKPEMIRGFIAKASAPVATVAVAEAKDESWVAKIPAIGTFRAYKGIDISPQVGGVVTALRFDSGQDVKKDDVLVQIDDSVEQADLKANVATLRNADVTLDRQKQLITSAATSKSTLDTAQATRDQAAAAVERSKALIAQKVLVAPWAGRMGLRKIDIGQYVSPGTSIVTLQQLDPIYVDFPIPEQNLAVLKAGQGVEVSVDAWPDKVFKGKISSIDARVSADTRNVLVRAEIPNPDKELRPGMFANVNVLAGEPRHLTTVPRTAVSYSLYGDSVFVVKAAPPASGEAQAASASDQPMVVEQRSVKVGEAQGDRVAVLDGLKAGERVVSEGQIKLQPGAHVKIDNSSALPPPAEPRPKG